MANTAATPVIVGLAHIEQRIGEQPAEGRGAREDAALGPEEREGRGPCFGVDEVGEHVAPAELVETGVSAIGGKGAGGGRQELVVGGIGDRHGSRRICLAMVSSCICWDPP